MTLAVLGVDWRSPRNAEFLARRCPYPLIRAGQDVAEINLTLQDQRVSSIRVLAGNLVRQTKKIQPPFVAWYGIDLIESFGRVADQFDVWTWLMSVERFSFYQELVRAILRLLPGATRLEIKGGRVWVSGTWGTCPITAMGGGSLSVLNWVVELVARQAGECKISEMRGLVLVDDLDSMIHPSHQPALIPTLRRIFPQMDFMVSVRNPMTLQGARQGEIFVLDREDTKVSIRQRDLPKGLRADQVICGPWFGLSSTLDMNTLGLLDRHRGLLSAGVPKADPIRLKIETELKERLR